MSARAAPGHGRRAAPARLDVSAMRAADVSVSFVPFTARSDPSRSVAAYAGLARSAAMATPTAADGAVQPQMLFGGTNVDLRWV